VIVFGLFMLDMIKIPALMGDKHLDLKSKLGASSPKKSFLLGSAFAFGWTPCVGPILGSVLLLATTSTTALQGALLLTIFSLGLGIPFLIMAFGIGSAYRHLSQITRYMNIISKIGGVFLVILGILLFTNNMGLLVAWGFKYLDFLNYERIQDFL